MAATSGYQAGIETNQTQLSYGVEATWGTRPTLQFQAIRYMSDTLALTKTRQRPAEINITREASQAVTTQQTAGGTINYALSYGTYDDFFASLAQNDWTAPYVITSIGTDITFASTGGGNNTLSSTLTTKFTNIQVGQWIRVSGFTVTTAFNNWFKVTAKADNSHLSLLASFGVATETSAGANVQITGSTLNNGTTFKSLFIQQKFSSSKFLRYGGAYVTRITLGTAIGNFFTGAIDLVCQSEVSATTDASTGATLAAPAGTVFDPVAGYVKLFFHTGASTLITGQIDQLNMTMENTGAAPEYSLGGTAGSVGILGGTFTASGSFRMYCNDFTAYDYFQSEFSADLSFYFQDKAGNSYVCSFENVILLCKIQVGGPGQAVYVQVDFEGNPDPTLGGTFQLDRHPPPH